MSYFNLFKRRTVLTSLLLSLWVIVLAIFIVTYIPFIYQMNVSSYGINTHVGLTNQQIVKAYTTICNYLSIFTFGDLKVPYFHLTKHTLIHFRDCKHLFAFLWFFFVAGAFTLLYLIYKQYKDRDFSFLKLTVVITILIIVFFGIVAALDFDDAFVIMHKLLFRNNYWLIDCAKDPVIWIFPEQLFDQLLITILVIIGVVNALFLGVYHFYNQKILNH